MAMNKRAILVSGGTLEKKLVKSVIQPDDFVIGVDKGAQALFEWGMQLDYMVGDFDSIDRGVLCELEENCKIPMRKFRPEKDASDTEIGLGAAIELGYKEILMLGATGTRLDHVWANVQTLCIAKSYGVEAKILDSNNRISLINRAVVLEKKRAYGKYFSLFSLGESVKGLSIKGAKYPLDEVELAPTNSLSVSNEFVEEKVEITYKSGQLILMETRDT